MGDGTFSMADGLGIKAVDSIELRRKQKNSVEHYGSSVVVEQNPLSLSPNSAKNLSQSRKIHPGQPNRSSSSQFDPTHKPFDLCPGAIPPSVLSSIPSNNPRPGTQQLYISGDFKSEPFLGNANQATSSSGYGPFSPKTAKPPSPSRKLQQVFEEALVREAEERTAELVNTKFDHQQVKVQLSNPNSQILFNARGNPYEKGDPSLGYSMEDNMPRRPHLESDPSQNVPAHRFTSNLNQKSSLREPSVPSQTHQINPKLNNGQVKSKPRNWASLLQSQNPSLDMKLEFFPDLQKGKEATVEIDIELTEVGKWNRHLVGHFLDGSTAYPLLAATARNQWKDLFVAVKPNVAGLYRFEFKDEQAKMTVLEGGP